MASVADRFQAARHTLTGNDVSKIVGKATTHEMGAPKRKHLDFLIASTHEPNVSLPECADNLLARVQDPSWVVSIKAMMSLHHLMNDGNEKFMRYMGSKGNSFEFISEKLGPMANDMSPFVNKYGHYLSEKCHAYRQAATDFIRISSTNFLRQATVDKLLSYVPILQRQIDGIVNLELNSADICTDISRSAFSLLFRDLIALFKIYNESIINMLEQYFEMEKKDARECFDLYKKFIVRMGKIEQFLKVAEDAGIDNGDVPDLSNAPSCLLSALENHLSTIDTKKSTPISSPTNLSNSPMPPKREEAAQALNPFGDTFAPPAQDLLSEPLEYTTQQAPPKSDLDLLTEVWSDPKSSPLIHNNANVAEQPFDIFTSGQGSSDLFPATSAAQAPSFSTLDLLSGATPEQNPNGFAQFGTNAEVSSDLLTPNKVNEPLTQDEKVQNVRTLMQDLNVGLKSAAANFSINSANTVRAGPALGPVRPISSGSTYNPFIRPGYNMMPGNMSMAPNMSQPAPGMHQGMNTFTPGMQPNMQANPFTPGMQGNPQMNQMRPMMQNPGQQPNFGQPSNLMQFNAMGNPNLGFPTNQLQPRQNPYDPFG